MSVNKKTIQVSLREDTIRKIRDLQTYLEVDTEGEALGRAVRIAHLIAKEINQGTKVILEYRDGTLDKLVIK